ncbi:MAG TPA: hypothetical protein VEV17_06940 [Bryobacteraceae bacterium]|nr:hypothetical protein [Bryobacteraceae bacterium]
MDKLSTLRRHAEEVDVSISLMSGIAVALLLPMQELLGHPAPSGRFISGLDARRRTQGAA